MRRIVHAMLLLMLLVSPAWAAEASRSIGRTHRTIMSAATAHDRAGRKQREATSSVAEIRKAVVHNQAARWALAKGQEKTAMHLTIEARRIARELLVKLGEGNSTSFDADPEETAVAAGGAGKAAEAALAEGEKKVPPVEELEDKLPYDVDQE